MNITLHYQKYIKTCETDNQSSNDLIVNNNSDK